MIVDRRNDDPTTFAVDMQIMTSLEARTTVSPPTRDDDVVMVQIKNKTLVRWGKTRARHSPDRSVASKKHSQLHTAFPRRHLESWELHKL